MIGRSALGGILLSALASMTPAQESGSAAIETVIRNQVADFSADDWAGAFEHASPAIRDIFGSAETFGQMVRNGYPMVWRPGELRFGPLDQRPERSLQPVIVFDQKGVPHALEYEMIRVGDSWKINGVRRLQAATGA